MSVISVNITGKTRIMGLIGNPVEHSISPQLHNNLCKHFDLNLAYLPFRVYSDDLFTVVEAFKALDVVGFNITIPHKVDIIKYLDNVSEEALIIGAVNTVRIKDKKLFGYNTDGQGFMRSLRDAGMDVKGLKVVILGAGGAARAVAVKLAQEGANSIVILNRSKEKARILTELVNNRVKEVAVFDEMTKDKLIGYTQDCNIIINTTSVGMWPEIDKSPIEMAEIFENRPFVCDLIYNPIKTKFLKNAEENSCKTLSGLGMLIYQGVSAFEIWNEINVPDNITKQMINKFVDFFKGNEGI